MESKENDDEDDLNKEEEEAVLLGKALPKFENGQEAILDELQEVNLGINDKSRPTFTSGNMFLKETKKEKSSTLNS